MRRLLGAFAKNSLKKTGAFVKNQAENDGAFVKNEAKNHGAFDRILLKSFYNSVLQNSLRIFFHGSNKDR
ncbi:MAG: hypothetical protein ACI4SV_02410 [Duodenibacillus sp.]